MSQPWLVPQTPRWKRLLRATLLGLVGLELLYVVVSNLALSSGIITHFANLKPEQLTLSYGRAWTLIPATVHVTDLKLRFQDRNVEFEIIIVRARLLQIG